MVAPVLGSRPFAGRLSRHLPPIVDDVVLLHCRDFTWTLAREQDQPQRRIELWPQQSDLAVGQDALAVDTHVFRVSQRLGLAKSDDPEEIHDQLVEVLPRGRLTQGTHLLIIHGRRTCVARKPACPKCSIRALCPWPGKTRS
jgi:hypothetical protein